MKKILIIKCGNTYPELKNESGDFEDWIINLSNLPNRFFTVYNLNKGERLAHPSNYHAAFITGIPEDNDPLKWIDQLKGWIVAARYSNFPVLGICYGAQIIAEALGGTLSLNKAGLLFGIDQINVTTRGMIDPLFRKVGSNFDSFHFHRKQVSKLPSGSEIIAYSKRTECEAFRIGRMYGIQFRPEFSPEIMKTYIDHEEEAQRRVRIKMKSGYKNQSLISNFIDLALKL